MDKAAKTFGRRLLRGYAHDRLCLISPPSVAQGHPFYRSRQMLELIKASLTEGVYGSFDGMRENISEAEALNTWILFR